MKVGDRIRYIGHTAKCKSCTLAGKPPKSSLPIMKVAGALDDRDEFDSAEPTNMWDYRLLELGVVTDSDSGSDDTVWVHMDNETVICNAYISHLEVIS